MSIQLYNIKHFVKQVLKNRHFVLSTIQECSDF